MAGKARLIFQPGTKIGHLTYLSDSIDAKSGERRVRVQCSCGYVFDTIPGTLKKENPMCYRCANKIKAQIRVRTDLVGKTVGLWKVIKLQENINGRNLYDCECLRCHNHSLKDSSSILYSKGTGWCPKCKPDFKFIIIDDYAIGTLPSGDKFFIDAEDIDRVNQYAWYKKSGQKYIVCNMPSGPKLRLHRFVLGLPPIEETENGYVVDHINRNPLDCRKENLRVATQHQNCFNKSLRSNNRYGLIGVSSGKNKYYASVGLNGKEIVVGQSEDINKCASMYNFASLFLFGEFLGQRNETCDLTDDEKEKIKIKCLPYINEAQEVTKAVAFFNTKI